MLGLGVVGREASGSYISKGRGEATGLSEAPEVAFLRFHSHLNEDGQAVVGVAGRVQVVLVLLRDVRHHHVDQRLHGVVKGGRETLVSGKLRSKGRDRERGSERGIGKGRGGERDGKRM